MARSLGGLQHNTVCSLHGWGGNLADHRRDSITVYAPQFCQPNMPQAYCTSFDITDCSAILASPITCGNDSIIDGFVLNNRSCAIYEGRPMLNYHSVSDFREWLENTTQQSVPYKSSINFVVYVAQYTSNIISATIRCSGTIIASNRVLTTADCVTIVLPLRLSVQSRGTSSTMTSHRKSI